MFRLRLPEKQAGLSAGLGGFGWCKQRNEVRFAWARRRFGAGLARVWCGFGRVWAGLVRVWSLFRVARCIFGEGWVFLVVFGLCGFRMGSFGARKRLECVLRSPGAGSQRAWRGSGRVWAGLVWGCYGQKGTSHFWCGQGKSSTKSSTSRTILGSSFPTSSLHE